MSDQTKMIDEMAQLLKKFMLGDISNDDWNRAKNILIEYYIQKK